MSEVINMAKFKKYERSDFHIVLEVEGATEEDLVRGVAAANAVFEEAGVDPWDAAKASHEMEWGDASNMTLSEEEADMGAVYWNAIEAALIAACSDLPNTPKKYDFCLVWDDDPPYVHNELDLEVIRPSTVHGKPVDQLTALKPGRRRKLVGFNWGWDESH